MWSIAGVTVWWTVGFNFLLYLAALQGIPAQHVRGRDHRRRGRAGAGCGPSPCPSCAGPPASSWCCRSWPRSRCSTRSTCSPRAARTARTRPILEYVYDIGFTNYRLGYASAVSYVFFALIIVVSRWCGCCLPQGGLTMSVADSRRPPDEGAQDPGREPGPHQADRRPAPWARAGPLTALVVLAGDLAAALPLGAWPRLSSTRRGRAAGVVVARQRRLDARRLRAGARAAATCSLWMANSLVVAVLVTAAHRADLRHGGLRLLARHVPRPPGTDGRAPSRRS